MVLLAGCANAEQRAVLSTVRRYVKLMNAEDAGGVFEITHQSARTLGYKSNLDLQFASYDINFQIEKLTFDKIEDGIATVDFVGTMKKTDNSDFKDMRLTGKFILEKERDDWKILGMDYKTEDLPEK
jgi:hypothetical protein